MEIRRNKNGKQNLNDIRKAVEENKDVCVYKQSGDWIISQWSDRMGAWMTSPAHPRHDEREAIQIALFGEYEPEECIEHYREQLATA